MGREPGQEFLHQQLEQGRRGRLGLEGELPFAVLVALDLEMRLQGDQGRRAGQQEALWAEAFGGRPLDEGGECCPLFWVLGKQLQGLAGQFAR